MKDGISAFSEYIEKKSFIKQADVNSAFPVWVAVPVRQESSFFHETLESLEKSAYSCDEKLAVVCAVNNRASDSEAVKSDNAALFAELKFNAAKNYPHLSLFALDYFSSGRGIPENQGVGYARKLAMDYALVNGAEVIACMDADTSVSEDYVSSLYEFRSLIAEKKTKRLFCLLGFEHKKEGSAVQQKAAAAYENYMKLHSEKLKACGTPYWPVALGPTLVCSAAGYVAAGGMNLRLAGEDFYFLQALIKLEISAGFLRKISEDSGGNVGENDLVSVGRNAGANAEYLYFYEPLYLRAVVYPSARISDRVLFGTGKKIEELCESVSDGTEPECPVFSDECYEAIKDFIEKKNPRQEKLAGFLSKENFSSKWDLIVKNNKKDIQLERAFHIWFDGLKIIRAIHSMI